jgi:hypothetical protein
MLTFSMYWRWSVLVLTCAAVGCQGLVAGPPGDAPDAAPSSASSAGASPPNVVSGAATAYRPKLRWSRRIGNGSLTDVAFDATGNLFVTGWISGAFDPSLGPLPGDSDPDAGTQDGYVGAFDPLGQLLWMQRWAAKPSFSGGAEVTIGPAGISVLGELSVPTSANPPQVDLGAGPVAIPNPHAPWGAPIGFVATYTNDGVYVSESPSTAVWTARDPNGNELELNSTTTDTGASEVGISKRAPDGTALWNQDLGPMNGQVVAAASESGALAVAGPMTGGGLDAGPFPCTPVVAAFDPGGTLVWSHRFAGTGCSAGVGAIAFDSSGDVLVGGSFFGPLDVGGPAPLMGPPSDSTPEASDLFAEDIFLVEYDAQGQYVWGRTYGETVNGVSSVGAIVFAKDQTPVIAGGLVGGTTSGPNYTTVGITNVFFAGLGSDGTTHWSASFDSPPGAHQSQQAGTLALGADGSMAIGGGFDGILDFGNGPLQGPSPGGSGGFVAVFDP